MPSSRGAFAEAVKAANAINFRRGLNRVVAMAKSASCRNERRDMAMEYLTGRMREINGGAPMRKEGKIVKRVEGVGKKDDGKMGKLVFRFEDGKTGRCKCAAFVEITETPEQRRVGLSKRASMSPNGGMFFDCKGPFWMKDVNFPLDLCYTDEYGRITEKCAMAKDELGTVLYPRTKSASVHAIELPSGFCDKYGIEIGDVAKVASLMGR